MRAGAERGPPFTPPPDSRVGHFPPSLSGLCILKVCQMQMQCRRHAARPCSSTLDGWSIGAWPPPLGPEPPESLERGLVGSG
eukprot:gene22538-biopygen20751